MTQCPRVTHLPKAPKLDKLLQKLRFKKRGIAAGGDFGDGKQRKAGWKTVVPGE
jgi:hypothetical protein